LIFQEMLPPHRPGRRRAVRRGRFGFWGAHAVLVRGGLLARQGRLDEARALIGPALQTLDASGCKCSLTHPYSFLAECLLGAGRVDDALAWLGRGFDLAENHNERYLESELLRLKGEALLAHPARLLNWYFVRVFRRCARDRDVLLRFYRVLHFLDQPTALFHPSMIFRVLTGHG
jgi:hypothetical protein